MSRSRAAFHLNQSGTVRTVNAGPRIELLCGLERAPARCRSGLRVFVSASQVPLSPDRGFTLLESWPLYGAQVASQCFASVPARSVLVTGFPPAIDPEQESFLWSNF